MPDKVKFGIKNVHIFPILSVDAAGNPTYDDVINVPGAVSLSMDAQGDINKFYADNIVYYQSASNNGYEGDLELALIPEAVLEQIFNYQKDANGVFTESASLESKAFAMTFEEDGDVTGTKFLFYNCTATRPSRSLATITETKEPTTQTLTVSAAPLATGNVMAMTSSETPEAVINTWHDSVYITSSVGSALVVFNSNGGSAVASQSVTIGEFATEPAAPTREGYTFVEWCSDLGLTTAWDFATDTVNGNMMLYAKWS